MRYVGNGVGSVGAVCGAGGGDDDDDDDDDDISVGDGEGRFLFLSCTLDRASCSSSDHLLPLRSHAPPLCCCSFLVRRRRPLVLGKTRWRRLECSPLFTWRDKREREMGERLL